MKRTSWLSTIADTQHSHSETWRKRCRPSVAPIHRAAMQPYPFAVEKMMLKIQSYG